MNYYELYQISNPFAIDASSLRKQMIALNKQYHPDRLVENDALLEGNMAELINIAYKTLGDEELNLHYYLELHGLINPNEHYNLAPDFLMEAMDRSELITEAIQNKDTEQLQKLSSSIIKQKDNSLQQLKLACIEHFKTGNINASIKQLYYELKYLRRQLNLIDGEDLEL